MAHMGTCKGVNGGVWGNAAGYIGYMGVILENQMQWKMEHGMEAAIGPLALVIRECVSRICMPLSCQPGELQLSAAQWDPKKHLVSGN